MVFGESSSSRSKNRVDRNWFLSGSCLSEVDQTKHLGILISVSGSSLNHISRSISLARSSFFALQPVGSRFGCLHPLTSLRLFKSIPSAILQYGLDLIYPTQTELLMLERGQLTMLRIVLGLPVRAPFYCHPFSCW